MRKHILEQYTKYTNFFDNERGNFEILNKQIESFEDLTNRKNMNGHITASGLVISADGKVLLIFHNAQKRFQQPGGHIDNLDKDVATAAMREVCEETALKEVSLHKWHNDHPHPLNIDSHHVAARPEKREGEHVHHDFIYVLVSPRTDVTLQKSEVAQYKWVDPFKEVIDSKHLARTIQKAMEQKILKNARKEI